MYLRLSVDTVLLFFYNSGRFLSIPPYRRLQSPSLIEGCLTALTFLAAAYR